MGQVPPNRGPVAEQEAADADGESLNRKFAAKKKQQPKRHDRNQKEFHAPECDSTDEAEEKKVACASGVFLFDDQKKNDERRDEQKVECVTAWLEMPLQQSWPEREDEAGPGRHADRIEPRCHHVKEGETGER